ncbi:MAG: hypothetical protein WCA57_16995, partial [Ilumatobacteraceae bacterium]
MRTTTRRAIAPLVALVLIGAACTSDDDSGDSGSGDSTPVATDAPEGTTAPEETTAPGDTVEVVQSDESKLDSVQSAG